MKAAKFDYVQADSVAAALAMLPDEGAGVKLMAGSQSLGPMLNLRLARPAKVVDVSAIADLRTVTEQGTRVRIGSAVTHAEIEDGVFPLLAGHMLRAVAGRIAYRAVRNRGTIGGSMAHADPAADWVLAVTALGGQVEITSGAGRREIAMPEFMLGAYTTQCEPDEMITAVYVPKLLQGSRWGYHKFARKTGEFAEASCAAYFDPVSQTARIAVGALDGAPQLLPELAEQVAAQGRSAVSAQAIRVAVAAITQQKSAWEQERIETVVSRCLAQAMGE